MKFKYSKDMYKGPVQSVFLIVIIIGIITYFTTDTIFTAITLSFGIGIILFISLADVYRNQFAFFIEENYLRIIYKKISMDYLWTDIVMIIEYKSYFSIKTNKDIELTILKKVNDEIGFRSAITQIINQYNIPFRDQIDSKNKVAAPRSKKL
ncbi:MAG: hypothetical protein CVU84_15230 [Firmicutes bacterium HGW-Firmicutes-1]|jgi:hypothetical protein|nr:MAG: hypothetical protein CVU84_15230 [Firmicutes bacterium HGW-Firmicutes-1]